MDVDKIAKIAEIAIAVANAGLPPILGGIKALAGLFGHTLTLEEQNAIEVAILIDARKRKAERQLMATPSHP